jgi:hypothetical protein
MTRTSNREEVLWVKHEASASTYEFGMLHLGDNRTALIDHKGAWSGMVNTYTLKTGWLDMGYREEVTEQLASNPTFPWSHVDAKNIIDGAVNAMYSYKKSI